MSAPLLMVDVDGVVIRPPRRWDADLLADLGVDPAALQQAFFRPHWRDIVLGEADLLARLTPVLATLAPGVSAETFVAYWFAKDAVLNAPLLAELAALRAAGTAMHLATVQEHHRARHLWEGLELRSRFETMHYSAALGAAKPARTFYDAVAARTGVRPVDILLIDDAPQNVIGAREAGWRASLYDGTRPLAEVIAAAA